MLSHTPREEGKVGKRKTELIFIAAICSSIALLEVFDYLRCLWFLAGGR